MTQPEWTTTKLLDWIVGYFTKAGIDSPRLRAEMLLAHVLGVQRIMLYIETPVAAEKLAELRKLVKQAGEHKPVEYILGFTTFYSLTIKVTDATLIPRPETEDLVRRAVDVLRDKSEQGCRDIEALDLGTGSGCIAAAIAKNTTECRITAADISQKALDTAAENFTDNGVAERITLLQGDLFSPLADNALFDVIVSNPPYVSKDEFNTLEKNIRDYEPPEALLAGEDGLDFYRKIAQKAPNYLKKDGKLILEIGFSQAEKVTDLLKQNGFKSITAYKDFAENDRVIQASIQ